MRELAPDTIINNRRDLADLVPDIVTPEQICLVPGRNETANG
ncbi:hypothetical protein ACVJBD_005866 [Rhizobium mongolense]